MILRSRRSFLKLSASAAAGLLSAPALVGCAYGPAPGTSSGTGLRTPVKNDPFCLGVAAGSPRPGGFVLWTRLAPDPLSDDPSAPGGMRGGPVRVAYEIAADPRMRSIVRKGVAMADPDFAYSVHQEVGGLVPGVTYWYRFMLGAASSRIGRVMAGPAAHDDLARLRIGIASCSNYEQGYFSAYRHMAEEKPDLVLFLGDYIYEGVDTRFPVVRRHDGGIEARTLAQYRNRYAQYRLDPDLQLLHAQVTALATWDDHEVDNDYGGEFSRSFEDPRLFLQRRAAAYRAFYEHMPLRPSLSRPNGAHMRIHDSYNFGSLAQIFMIDGRQYRSPSPCYGPPDGGRSRVVYEDACPERLSSARSMLGAAQEKWLFGSLSASRAKWNVLGQNVLMAENRQHMEGGRIGYWSDDWNGYPAARDRLIRHMHECKLANPAVFGGDVHAYWVNELKLDFADHKSPSVASEFVGTSISSYSPPYEKFMKFVADNPHMKYFESRHRGYILSDIEKDRMTTKLQIVSDGRDPQARLATLKTYVTEAGRANAMEA